MSLLFTNKIKENMKIYVRNNDVNKALRVLKKKLFVEGDLKEMRERQHFVSPGEKKRLAERAGRKRWLKKRAKIESNMERNEMRLINRNRAKARSNKK
jgi:small subunit ribosomal protein S21